MLLSIKEENEGMFDVGVRVCVRVCVCVCVCVCVVTCLNYYQKAHETEE